MGEGGFPKIMFSITSCMYRISTTGLIPGWLMINRPPSLYGHFNGIVNLCELQFALRRGAVIDLLISKILRCRLNLRGHDEARLAHRQPDVSSDFRIYIRPILRSI